MIDRVGLAGFLRRRRESLQPEDVGLPRGQRRRTAGLRREEVATLCHISADYYSRLERERGPHPSEQMIASIAQGLRLSLDERDHLFRLAGHNPPARGPVLLDPDQSHTLLVHTAVPGSESYEKLRLLSVIGSQQIAPRRSRPAGREMLGDQ